jgi:hypothetical protein
MSKLSDTIIDKYFKGSLDITSLTPYDFFSLQAYLLHMKKYSEVQKFASIARNRREFTGRLV